MTTTNQLKVYYDKDVDTKYLLNKKVAVIGYGSQGHGQVLSLKDSGANVKSGLRIGGPSQRKLKLPVYQLLALKMPFNGLM